ncbi:hypothetical protein B296_00018968 [Ensete ventricosum]|uniref:Uncharacterized protein n=1 Tax=Ensete ventricosum TaxID=4639 RepID=A0A427A1L5_ENSVE|nr:hypothetical protein B296_00018968 [Ensete ventricosum]
MSNASPFSGAMGQYRILRGQNQASEREGALGAPLYAFRAAGEFDRMTTRRDPPQLFLTPVKSISTRRSVKNILPYAPVTATSITLITIQ